MLEKLKHLATAKPSGRTTPTGMPSYAHQLKVIRMVHKDTKELSSCFSEHAKKMIDAVRTTIENNDIRSGELNLSTLEVSICTGVFSNVLTFHVGKIKRAQ